MWSVNRLFYAAVGGLVFVGSTTLGTYKYFENKISSHECVEMAVNAAKRSQEVTDILGENIKAEPIWLFDVSELNALAQKG